MKLKIFIPSFMLALLLASCTSSPAHAQQTGYASWYGGKFHGRQTANGEIFDTYKLTAAHQTLPFDTIVKVVNLENGKSTVVRINDRGPFAGNRIIDLSFAAAREIGMIETGIVRVRLEIIEGSADKAESYVYKIQIAAYSSEANAEAAYKKLVNAGFKPDYERSGGIIRVVLADIEGEDIEKTKKELHRAGYRDFLVRKEIKF